MTELTTHELRALARRNPEATVLATDVVAMLDAEYKAQRAARKEVLFHLPDGTPVHKGNILWHPDSRNVGWYCVAEFAPRSPDADTVTVRAPNGAVPHVYIADLRSSPSLERAWAQQDFDLLLTAIAGMGPIVQRLRGYKEQATMPRKKP